MPSALPDLIRNLGLEDDEAAKITQIAMAAAANVQPDGLTADPVGGRLLQTLSRIIARDLPAGSTRTHFAVWPSAIPFLDARLHADLVAESDAQKQRGGRLSNHVMASGGVVASSLLASPQLARWMESSLGLTSPVEPTECFFHYYDRPDHRAEFHIDQIDFTFNILVVLRQAWHERSNSAFYIVPCGERPVRLDLTPGGGIAFGSAVLLHCRSAPAERESVTTVSFGFRETR